MKFCLGKKYGIPMLVIQTAGFYSSGAGVERELIVQSSRFALNYVCMYAVTLQECNYGFYARTHRHHNSCIGRPHGAMARQKRA